MREKELHDKLAALERKVLELEARQDREVLGVVSPKDLARMLGKSDWWIYQLIRYKKLPSTRIAGRVFVKLSDAKALFESGKIKDKDVIEKAQAITAGLEVR